MFQETQATCIKSEKSDGVGRKIACRKGKKPLFFYVVANDTSIQLEYLHFFLFFKFNIKK